MIDFSNVYFHGTFRDYQQNILDNIEKHIKDKRIHIVAAPGSGKTILGLEIIRRINNPALILSPTITIKNQWGDRFKDKFLDINHNFSDYVSYDLHDIKLINSLTYQGLHSAFHQLVSEEVNEELDEDREVVNYSSFDLIKTIKSKNIKTICLDEAHHLRNEWQKSLEEFIKLLDDDIIIISLTATPPYDSSLNEWKKYISLCGEIDEEIFVPELVSQKTLCPHQDYIYFNYPTKDEISYLKEYKYKAIKTINELVSLDSFNKIIKDLFNNYRYNEDHILENVKEYIAILTLVNHYQFIIPKKLIKLVSPSYKLPKYKLKYSEIAFQFIIDRQDLFKEFSHDIKKTLLANGLIERKKVCFNLNNRLSRLLVSSTGKLKSISDIVLSEYESLGYKLRMLVLTDYIKKDMIKIIGTDNSINVMGTVSIFENIRRTVDDEVSIAILSGSLIVVHNKTLNYIKDLASKENINYTYNNLVNTNYVELKFSGSNKNKVAIITKFFEEGLINVLVGTKSLLGEGWDSPCINSLILASFVGTYMLSNQMRGRAIRSYRNDPDKTANIWHLVTIEPYYIFSNNLIDNLYGKIVEDNTVINSCDYETLERRFNCFLAPSYISNTIESGIERVEIIKPPFNSNSFKKINQHMIEISKDRRNMKKKWDLVLSSDLHPNILETSEIPPKVSPTSFVFVNVFYELILTVFLSTFINGLLRVPLVANTFINLIVYLVIISFIIYLMFVGAIKILKFMSPKLTIKTLSKCILYTLKDLGEIKSIDAKVVVKSDSLGQCIYCSIDNASRYEKNVYTKAISELLSAIANPRYLLVKKGIIGNNYSHSYACPSIIGAKKENAEIFQQYLERSAGKFKLIYTRNENGRKYILKCRRYSYISINDDIIKNRRRVDSKWS